MSVALVLVAAVALLVTPGAVICLVAGTRWRDAVAAGPALTLAVVAVAPPSQPRSTSAGVSSRPG